VAAGSSIHATTTVCDALTDARARRRRPRRSTIKPLSESCESSRLFFADRGKSRRSGEAPRPAITPRRARREWHLACTTTGMNSLFLMFFIQVLFVLTIVFLMSLIEVENGDGK
jgi:hypothetical protein